MTVANRIATAYVQIVPTAEGITNSLTQVIKPEAESAGTEAGESVGSNLADVAKKIIAAAGIGMAIKSSIDAVGDLAAYGDTIDKQSQKIGISRKAYQEWDAVLQHSGTSISTMQGALRTLSNAAVDGSDAFEKVGLSLDDVQKMSQEDLFSAVITQLQGMEAGTERTALAQDLLGRGAQEMAALLNTSAEDTQKMKDAVNDLGGVMSDDAVLASAAYQDSLQDMKTAMDGAKRNILSNFLPAFSEVMQGVTQVFGGDASSGVGIILSGVGNIGSALSEAVPAALDGARQIAEGILNGLYEVVPGIVQQIPEFVSAGVQSLTGFLDGFLENIPALLDGVGEMLSQMVSYLMTDGIPMLAESAVSLVGGLVQALWDNLPTILTTAGEMILSVGQTFVDNLPTLATNLSSVFQSAGNAAKEAFKNIDWASVGQSAISFIASAASEVGSLVMTALRNIGQTAMIAFRTIDWSGVGRAVIGFIGNAASGAIGLVTTALRNIGSRALETFRSIDWRGVGRTVISFIASAAGGAIGLVTTALRTIGSNALQTFRSIDWRGVGRTVIGFIASAAGSAGSLIINALRNAGRNAMAAFRNIDWRGVGSAVINGIKNGITNAASSLATAARNAASNALSKVKGFLGIHSPSSVFRDQVGKMMGEGWAQGITDTAGKLAESAGSASRGAMRAAQDAFDGLNLDNDVSISARLRTGDNLQRMSVPSGRLAVPEERATAADAVLNLLLQYLPLIAQKGDVYLDTDRLVGALAGPMDRELGYRLSISRG